MRYLLQLEQAGLFGLAIFGLYLQPLSFPWWVWILLFLLPDVGMIGYAINTQVGALTYNLLHHQFTGAAVLGIGYFTNQPYLVLAGLVLLGHASFDRTLGYGLKFPDSFKHTHLGSL